MLSHHKTGATERGMHSSLKSIRSQKSSAVVVERERYSAYVLERETTACFLALQEMRQSPKNTAKPVVERDHPDTLPSQSHIRHLIEDDLWYSKDHDQENREDIVTLS
jgi:hypothetical protein